MLWLFTILIIAAAHVKGQICNVWGRRSVCWPSSVLWLCQRMHSQRWSSMINLSPPVWEISTHPWRQHSKQFVWFGALRGRHSCGPAFYCSVYILVVRCGEVMTRASYSWYHEVRLPAISLSCNDSGQVVDSVTKQYNLLLAKGWWWSAVGKIATGLVESNNSLLLLGL